MDYLRKKSEEIFKRVGNTPLVRIGGVYAKLESKNPSGSIKDRMTAHMLADAIRRGQLDEGSTILEVTSGNTGISFAYFSAALGFHFTAVMPESMSIERKQLLKSYGARVELTPANEDMIGAVRRFEELAKEMPDAYLPRQFENPLNVEAHWGTAREILAQVEGKIGAIVAGIGTGGTLLGIAEELGKEFPDAKVIGVEPAESAVLSGKKPGTHGIMGIGEGFIPKIVEWRRKTIDEVVQISTADAIDAAKYIAAHHGIPVGISSGANFLAAKSAMEKVDGKVVTVLPDGADRYLSVWKKKRKTT